MAAKGRVAGWEHLELGRPLREELLSAFQGSDNAVVSKGGGGDYPFNRHGDGTNLTENKNIFDFLEEERSEKLAEAAAARATAAERRGRGGVARSSVVTTAQTTSADDDDNSRFNVSAGRLIVLKMVIKAADVSNPAKVSTSAFMRILRNSRLFPWCAGLWREERKKDHDIAPQSAQDKLQMTAMKRARSSRTALTCAFLPTHQPPCASCELFDSSRISFFLLSFFLSFSARAAARSIPVLDGSCAGRVLLPGDEEAREASRDRHAAV